MSSPLTPEALRRLIEWGAIWHLLAQTALTADRPAALRYAYRQREDLASYIASHHPEITADQARARMIVAARSAT